MVLLHYFSVNIIGIDLTVLLFRVLFFVADKRFSFLKNLGILNLFFLRV